MKNKIYSKIKIGKLSKDKRKLADRIFKDYLELAEFSAIYTLGEVDSVKGTYEKTRQIIASLMSFACTVLEGEMMKHGKKQK